MFKKLYNGEYSLAKTYGLFGLLGSWVVRLIVILPSVFEQSITGKILTIALTIPACAYLYIISFGITRAGKKYQGSFIWKYLAYISLFLNIFLLVFLQIVISVVNIF